MADKPGFRQGEPKKACLDRAGKSVRPVRNTSGKKQSPPAGRNALPGQGGGIANPSLLRRPGPESLAALELAFAATAEVFPLSAAHRKDLLPAVRDLSHMLTVERGELSRSYWSAPRYLAAYLHYFLPWNLYRLFWLLPGLDLPLLPGSRILDLGSGPLTLPVALWCARPDLRSVPLEFHCADVSLSPMEHGRALLQRLAGAELPWRVTLVRAPLEKTLRDSKDCLYDCIMAGNVLNELKPRKHATEDHLGGHLELLMALAANVLAPKGRVLLVEPGTRLGGKLVALARQGALRQGFRVLSPCPHQESCPLLEAMSDPRHPPGLSSLPDEKTTTAKRRRPPLATYSGWCHFTHPTQDAPLFLREFSRKARLEKRAFSLSCLLLEGADSPQDSLNRRPPGDDSDDLEGLERLFQEIMADETPPACSGPQPEAQRPSVFKEPERQPDKCPARILSGPISIPDREAGGEIIARYACCAKGLALVKGAAKLPSGASVLLPWPKREERDAKTGALLFNTGHL